MKKGSLVFLTENNRGELVLNPENKIKNKEKKETTIEEVTNLKDLRRKLITSYIEGYDTIKITSKNLKNTDRIRFFINSLISLEIVETTETKIIVKDLLDFKEININKQIKRIDLLIRNIFEDSKISHQEKNYEEIYNTDYEVTKLTYLGQRILRKCLHNPNLTKDVKIEPEELINLWELYRSLNTISHLIKNISKTLNKTGKSENFEEILEIYTKIQTEYHNVMNAYYKNNKKIAHEIDARKDKILRECDDLIDKVQNPKKTSILENMKNIELSIKNICKSVQNK